jgi:hypothetical protein
MATPNPNIIYRSGSSEPLTFEQLDGNFALLSQSIADMSTPESASYALSASYVEISQTASYVDASNIDGTVANADNAATASYIDAANIDGQVASALNADNATTASYVDAVNIDGTVTSASYALSASYAPASNPFPFIGDAEFSGSILVSGSIIPNTDGVSSTSSFDLGSPTAAWKDIYVSNGTINFLNGAGTVVQTMGTGNNQLTGDTFINGRLSQGTNVTASGLFSHAEGSSSLALGTGSHAEGLGTIAAANYQHVSGKYNITSSNPDDLFIIGNGSANNNRSNVFTVDINGSLVKGKSIISGSLFVNIPGQLNQVIQGPNHGIGGFPGAIGIHIEGITNQVGANASYSHVEGIGNGVEGYACHAEGEGVVIGTGVTGSHAEGYQTKIASGANYSHVEGTGTIATGSYSHAEGAGTITLGTASHAEGLETIAKGNFQHVSGQYNATSSVDSAFIVGNGFDGDNRSNLIFAAEETVSINNILQLTPRSTNPISPVEGSIMASGSAGSSKLYYYNGTTWVDLTA